jgi:hypothetical protein
MNPNNHFRDSEAIQSWERYFRKVDHLLRPLSVELAADHKAELESHLLESFTDAPGECEVEKLGYAIDRLGEPKSYLKAIVGSELLVHAASGFKPIQIIRGLYYNVFLGASRFILSFLFGLTYFLIGLFTLLPGMKLIIPQNVGLFHYPEGGFAFGIVSNLQGAQEILGYWLIPGGLLLALFLYFAVSKLLGALMNAMKN